MQEDVIKSLNTVVEFIESIFLSQDVDKLLEKSSEFLVQTFKLSNCCIKFNGKKWRYFANSTDTIYEQVEALVEGILKDLKTPVVIKSLKEDKFTHAIKDVNLIAQSVAAFPLIENRNYVGSIFLYSELDLNNPVSTVEIISEKFLRAAANIQRFDEAKKSSITDPLTDLYNRNYMTSFLDQTVSKARQLKSPTSLIMCDVDNFKNYNDTKGHLEGDYLLKKISACLRNSFRFQDVICRYGGEEFVVILPNTDAKTAQERAEQLRDNVQKNVELTVSVGVITCLNSSLSAQDLLKHSDEALYQAKRMGKNKVVSRVSVDKNMGVV